MYKFISRFLNIHSKMFHSLSFVSGHSVSAYISQLLNAIIIAFRRVNRRKPSTIFTPLLLCALLSACGDGTTETTSDANASTTPTFSISSHQLTLIEDFATAQSVATVNNATSLTVNLSSLGVVNVSTTVAGVTVSRIANKFGRTTLTISASNGNFRASTQVVVIVNSVNDTPTLFVSTAKISTNVGFSAIIINTTASDVEDSTLSFSVLALPTGVVRVTTSTNAILLNAISGISGQTTLTVRTIDSSSSEVSQTIAVNVAPAPSIPPVLVISTNRIIVLEDFRDSVVINTTATDADGDTMTLSVSSTSRFIDVAISTPINGQSTITNSLTLSSIVDFNGTATLTVQATDSGGIYTTEQIVVVVNPVNDPISFSLSTQVLTLSTLGNQLNRNIQIINISNPDNEANRTQLQIISSGNPIFSTNPTPVVSFTTNALTTVTTLTSSRQTAQLYFSIAPNQTGTATLTVQLNNLTTSEMSQQSLVVQVQTVDVPPVITHFSTSLTRLIVHGGRLYANSIREEQQVKSFLAFASSMDGHLVNINTVEEFNFLRSTASDLVSHNAWFGLVLPKRTFPGELSWMANDSTIAYGIVSTNGVSNLTVYPGHFQLPWDAGAGLTANRVRRSTTVFNWTVYSRNLNKFLLLDDGGDPTPRRALYEFPNGIDPDSINSSPVRVLSNATFNLTGFDLNGDEISANDWSIMDPAGGTAIFSSAIKSSGVQTVQMLYTAATNYNGLTTAVITLQVNGLSTTSAILFSVDSVPTIALSTQIITLSEDFGNFVIGTTVTDQGVSGSLPFSVQTTSTGVVNLSTTSNAIQFSGAAHFNGLVTLTVQTTDSALQSVSTLVVVTIQAVNDTPTLTVSTDNISTNGGFNPITIDTKATDVEDVTPPFSVKTSTTGVVSFTTSVNNIMLSSIQGGSGQTTLTVTVTDSSGAVVIRTIAVNVRVVQSTTPVLRVSTNLFSLQEDFGSVVIGTTATDSEAGTLVFTVSSTTHLVNTVISTHSITLSSVANRFGATTLTVLARDPGRLFDSTEIVVIVQSVNDTPTLTVSSNVVSLGADSVVLSVSAFDVEDTTLSYSASSGHVNTVITTTSLTISRIGFAVSQVLLTLRTTDSNGVSVSTSVTVVLPPLFVITTGIKTLDFAWSAVSTATYYQLRSNPNGRSGFTDLSTTGIVVSPISTNIRQSTAQGLVSLHQYIPRVVSPRYQVYPCNGASCGAAIGNTVILSNDQLNTIIGRLLANNAGSLDEFGASISLSGDGNTLAVGARLEDGFGRGINPAQDDNLENSGAVYVFRRNGGVWSQQAFIKASNSVRGNSFGNSVSLSADGNTLAVGSQLEDSSATDSGAVYVFRYNTSTWAEQAMLKASNASADDLFGTAVHISADGNTLAVGANMEDSLVNNSGAAYVFRFTTSNTWAEQAVLKAFNPGDGDFFGSAVGISADGNTLAVGATGEDSGSTGIDGVQNDNTTNTGAVYLFRYTTASIWTQQAYIKASNSQDSDSFGTSVRSNGDGNTLVVGATGEDSASTMINGTQSNNSASGSGAAYVFRYSTSANAWTQQAYIKASNAGAVDGFGGSVSLSLDGNALVVGATGEDGTAIGVEGNNDASTTISNSGAAYVFEFSNGRWVQQAYIKASDPSSSAFFGQSVSISQDGATVAVGAHRANAFTGAVYLY